MKVAPPLVLTSRMQITEIGRMVTLFVSRTVTEPPGFEPVAVTTFSVSWQWLTAGMIHCAVCPTSNVAGNPQLLKLRSGSGELLSVTVNASGKLPELVNVIR